MQSCMSAYVNVYRASHAVLAVLSSNEHIAYNDSVKPPILLAEVEHSTQGLELQSWEQSKQLQTVASRGIAEDVRSRAVVDLAPPAHNSSGHLSAAWQGKQVNGEQTKW